MVDHDPTLNLIFRVQQSICYEAPEEVCKALVAEGITPEEAWIAIKAAQLLSSYDERTPEVVPVRFSRGRSKGGI